MVEPIPFNKPFIVGKELEYIAQAVSYGNIGADGHFTQRCSQLLQQELELNTVLMTPSCTAALEMAAMLCNFEPGDEVVLPSFTFVSTANAIVRAGAKPVFAEIRTDTMNIDERLVADAISERTRAIFPVHYAGVGCEMDPLLEIARDHQLTVVEDAAQGVNAYYRNRSLGSIGDLATFSFHETKNYICGEGGALCVNRPELVERANVIRDKGTNRQQFIAGDVDKYSWVDVGGSYVPSEIVCAFLLGQLEAMQAITAKRCEMFQRYEQRLAVLQQKELAQLPYAPEHCRSNCHMFYLVVRDQETRDRLIAHLRTRSIHAVFHYVPLHASPMGTRFGYKPGDLPRTESISAGLLRLPMYHELTELQQHHIIDEVLQFFGIRE